MDLLKEWDAVLGEKVSAKMLTWIDQVGYPLVTVVEEQFGESEVVLTLNQRHYLESGEETDQGKLWFIPLFVNSDAGEQ